MQKSTWSDTALRCLHSYRCLLYTSSGLNQIDRLAQLLDARFTVLNRTQQTIGAVLILVGLVIGVAIIAIAEDVKPAAFMLETFAMCNRLAKSPNQVVDKLNRQAAAKTY